MAGRKIKGINIKLGVDTTGLDTALSDINSKSKSTKTELVEVNKALNNNKDSVILWQQKQELLGKAFDVSKEKLNMLESAQKDVNKQLENKAIIGEQYRAFQRELENARAEAKRFGGQLEEAENKVKELSGTADKTAESAHDLGDDLKEAGEQAQESADGGFTVLKGAISNLASDAIKAAADAFKEFAAEGEEALNTIQTRTGATAEEMQQYSEVMSNLYANNFGEDKADLAESISSIKQQLGELSPEELEKITERAILMRDTFGYDVAESIRTVKMLMDQFEVSADEAYTLIAQGAQKGLDKNGDLLDTLNEYSVHYKTMGYSAEEFFNSLTNGTEAGTFSVDKLGNAMKEFGIRTKDTADSTTEGFDLIGLNADEMRDKFAQGGTAAQEATQQTIDALFSLDDKVKMNQAGVDLFGTMWEDLGKDGVSALMDVSGEADKTASTLEDINKIKYDSAKSQFEQLKRKIITDLLEPAAQKLMPKIEDGTEWLIDNLPDILETGKKLLPVVKGAGTAFAAWKISEKAKPGAAALKNLFASVKSGNSVMQVFNATLKANPIGAVTTAIGAATAAIDLFRSSAKRKEEDRRESLAALIKDEYKEAAERINDTKDSIKEMKDSFNEQAGTIEAETGRTQALWDELQTLADTSGNVKDADKIRAEYILGELNDALGTEYEMTGNQIENYKTMQSEIDKLIEKKKAMAYIDAYGADAVEYEKLRTQSLEDYASNKTAFDEYDRQMEQIRIKASQLTGRYIADETELGDLLNNLDLTGNDLQNSGVGLNAIKKLVDPYNDLIGNYITTRDNMNEALTNYNKANAFFNTYDEGMKAASEGRYDEVGSILYANDNANVMAYKNAGVDDVKRAEAFKKALTEQLNALDAALKSGRSDTVNATIATLSEIVKDGKKYGFELGDEFTGGLKTKVKEMTDKDFDVSGIIEMGRECGLDTGEVWSGEFKGLVQAQLDNGYDIRSLLAWGEISGRLTASDYSGKFGQEVQNYISSMYPDTEGLMQWAAERGMTLGELFGENFTNYANAYMEAQFWESGNAAKTISSAWDAAKYAANDYKPDIPMFASGGFLGSGKGIVAEAGPELIEIINGGAKITPLTSSARNTPVTSAGSGRNVYINNTINASISSGYDVRRLAADLADEQRRVERNLGL